MDKIELLRRLEQLDLQIWDITEEVNRFQKVISQLDAASMDNSDAQLSLARLENLLIGYLQERQQLHEALAKLARGTSHGPPSTDR